MTFRPLHGRIAVRRTERDSHSSGGIIIPERVQEKPQEGDVVAVGPGGRDESGHLVPIELRPGDHVMFGKWSGTEARIDNQDLLLMKEADVLGVVETEAAL